MAAEPPHKKPKQEDAELPAKPKLTRVHQACRNCAARKSRCDGEKPACRVCLNSGQTCIYTETKKRGPPKGGKRKPKNEESDDNPTDRIKSLEAQVAYLQSHKPTGPPFSQQSSPVIGLPFTIPPQNRNGRISPRSHGALTLAGIADTPLSSQSASPALNGQDFFGRARFNSIDQHAPLTYAPRHAESAPNSAVVAPYGGISSIYTLPAANNGLGFPAQPHSAHPSYGSYYPQHQGQQQSTNGTPTLPPPILPQPPPQASRSPTHDTSATPEKTNDSFDRSDSEDGDPSDGLVYRGQYRGASSGIPKSIDALPNRPPFRLPSLANAERAAASVEIEIPRELTDRLIKIYFSYAHTLWPFIYKPELNPNRLDEGMDEMLVDAICALAARCLDDKTDFAIPAIRNSASGEMFNQAQLQQYFYDRAKRKVQLFDMRSDVTTIQSLLILALRDNGCGRAVHGWHFIGTACRMAVDMGLHRKSSNHDGTGELSIAQIETRRRVYWSCYIMDKWCCAQLGRPTYLREIDCDVPFPNEDQPEEWEIWVPASAPSNVLSRQSRALSSFGSAARLIIILEHIITDIYSIKSPARQGQTTDGNTSSNNSSEKSSGRNSIHANFNLLRKHHGDLLRWKANLPEHLRCNGAQHADHMLPHNLIMHGAYFVCELLLYRPFVTQSGQVMPHHGIPRPHDVCTNAANHIMIILDAYMRNFNLRKVSSTMVYICFTAAVMHVANSTSKDADLAQQAKVNLEKCIRVLDNLSDTWSSASLHRQILLDLKDLPETRLKSLSGATKLLASRVPSRAMSPAVVPNNSASLLDTQSQAVHSNLWPLPEAQPAVSQDRHGFIPYNEYYTYPINQMGSSTTPGPQMYEPFMSADQSFWGNLPIASEDVNSWNMFTQQYARSLAEGLP